MLRTMKVNEVYVRFDNLAKVEHFLIVLFTIVSQVSHKTEIKEQLFADTEDVTSHSLGFSLHSVTGATQ